VGIVLSGVFLTNSVEKHDNMQIIKGLLLVGSTIKIAGPLQESQNRGPGGHPSPLLQTLLVCQL
jgi:hypothetical protein